MTVQFKCGVYVHALSLAPIVVEGVLFKKKGYQILLKQHLLFNWEIEMCPSIWIQPFAYLFENWIYFEIQDSFLIKSG